MGKHEDTGASASHSGKCACGDTGHTLHATAQHSDNTEFVNHGHRFDGADATGSLICDQRAWMRWVECILGTQGDIFVDQRCHREWMQYLCAKIRHLTHLLKGQHIDRVRFCHNARVSAEHAIHIFVIQHFSCVYAGRDDTGAKVSPIATQGRRHPFLGVTDEAGNNRHNPRLQQGENAIASLGLGNVH